MRIQVTWIPTIGRYLFHDNGDFLEGIRKRRHIGEQNQNAFTLQCELLSHGQAHIGNEQTLNYRISGEKPETYRVLNLALHLACCGAMFGLSCALFGDRRLAGLSTALFAVHALHVEAVAQIVGRAELLAALWSMLALWLYVVDANRRGGRPTWRYPIVLVLSGLAMFSKENGMLVVGRGASYIRRGHDPGTRGRVVMFELGQAAGIAAALAAEERSSARTLDVKSLQRALLEQGFYLGDDERLRELGLA